MLTLMPGDENGLFPNETTADLPSAPVAAAQAAEASFVKAWLSGEWPIMSCHSSDSGVANFLDRIL
jgi:hypothetical protein